MSDITRKVTDIHVVGICPDCDERMDMTLVPRDEYRVSYTNGRVGIYYDVFCYTCGWDESGYTFSDEGYHVSMDVGDRFSIAIKGPVKGPLFLEFDAKRVIGQ